MTQAGPRNSLLIVTKAATRTYGLGRAIVSVADCRRLERGQEPAIQDCRSVVLVDEEDADDDP
jgi:hypothetical protein